MNLKPLRTSSLAAGGYIIICSLYIWLSGNIAEKMSESLPALKNIELYKGLAFVMITGILIFVSTYALLSKIREQNSELDAHRKALIDAQARALTGTFAAGIAHDMNNVLTIVDFSITELKDVVPKDREKEIERINKAFTLVQSLSVRLQEIGKSRTESDMKEVDMGGFIRETLDFTRRHKKLKNCKISYLENSKVTLRINPYLFEHMLINLLINAADATDSKGEIEVILNGQSDKLHIEVHDNGPGISPELKDNLFRPFKTTKSDGTGLGLANTRTCTKIHGGTIEIDRSHLGGALFRVVLPVSQIVQSA